MSDTITKRKNIRLHNFDYSRPGAYFLTICTESHRAILSRVVGTGVPDGPKSVELLPYGAIADKYINQLDKFYSNIKIAEYIIMPNHIHMIIRILYDGPSRTPVPTKQNSIISRFISTFKRFCNKDYGKNIWQYRSFDHIIRDEDDYTKHLEYIRKNPLRWETDEFFCQ